MDPLSNATKARLLVYTASFCFFLAAGSVFKTIQQMRLDLPESDLVLEDASAAVFSIQNAKAHSTYILLGIIAAQSCLVGAILKYCTDREKVAHDLHTAMFDERLKEEIEACEYRMRNALRTQTAIIFKSIESRHRAVKPSPTSSPPVWQPTPKQPPPNRRYELGANRALPNRTSPSSVIQLHKEVTFPVQRPPPLVTPPMEDHSEIRELSRNEIIERLAEAKVRKYRRVCIPVRGWVSSRQLMREHEIADEEVNAALDRVTISVEEVCKGDWNVPMYQDLKPTAKV